MNSQTPQSERLLLLHFETNTGAALQPYGERSTVSIPEYILAFIYKLFFKIHTCTFSNMESACFHIRAQKKQKWDLKYFAVSLHTDKILATFPQKDFTEVLTFAVYNKFFNRYKIQMQKSKTSL